MSEESTKGEVHVVHLYPREMSIYGDLGNTRAMVSRLTRHGYSPVLHQHHPVRPFRSRPISSSAAAARTPGRPGSRPTSRSSHPGCANSPPPAPRC